ncbi:MAG: LPS export ABC transporter periplasmic protein LptC [Novosphingobium sp.]|uniref:LPS export ABC transporter periplasmic protein LptC n=1 Tax=Novosphingobium sp. TaxID=1874826 RepID=UPI003C79C65C
MSQQADLIRDKRRHWAAPGSWRDRKIKLLAVLLPGLVGMVAAAMVVGPLFTHGEISFLLDRTKVAATNERIRVSQAMYRGEDKQGRPFTLTAGSAVQKSLSEPLVRMEDLAARIRLSDGPAELTAARGTYDYKAEVVQAEGPVSFFAADGYRITTQNVTIDLNTRRLTGSGGVSGAVPVGTFRADRMSADLDQRILTLDGNVRLLFQNNSFRMPR